MNEAYKLNGTSDLAGLNKQIEETQRKISDLQAELTVLQHRKGQKYVEREEVEDKRPESSLAVVYSSSSNAESPNGDINWVCWFTTKSKPTIYRWVSENIIPHTKPGKDLVFNKDEIMAWWSQYRVPTKAEKKTNILRKLGE